jgi:MoxR-like ATPase
MSDFVQPAQLTEAKNALDRLRANMRLTIRGKDDVINQVLICLTAGGHLLIEDLPGVGKPRWPTRWRARWITSFPDPVLSDSPERCHGRRHLRRNGEGVRVQKGPVFANVVLADEINRATPKTQSALLEVMDRA